MLVLHRVPGGSCWTKTRTFWPIIAYCRGAYCILSFDAVKSLREKGYNARRVADGIPDWLVANLKLVKPK
jgi:rhodanese-related sulfurtransferase